ncbi:hypothetical protein D9613_011154 [Agrocybe pediades]|uniref:Uncharacterized protein n=1 Tax=Agrocybe pediades TaxID=84607 RepID=A0A8H4QM77_9AGAR|nr:hypothetical protein D9613_011154 [Agrocybe pediades]
MRCTTLKTLDSSLNDFRHLSLRLHCGTGASGRKEKFYDVLTLVLMIRSTPSTLVLAHRGTCYCSNSTRLTHLDTSKATKFNSSSGLTRISKSELYSRYIPFGDRLIGIRPTAQEISQLTGNLLRPEKEVLEDRLIEANAIRSWSSLVYPSPSNADRPVDLPSVRMSLCGQHKVGLDSGAPVQFRERSVRDFSEIEIGGVYEGHQVKILKTRLDSLKQRQVQGGR